MILPASLKVKAAYNRYLTEAETSVLLISKTSINVIYILTEMYF